MKNYRHFRYSKNIFSFLGMIIGGVILAAVIALLFGFLVMQLWNWLIPEIFGLTAITFWQAWGLVVLSHILFKSFPHKNHHNHDDYWKRKFQRKYFCEHDNTAEDVDGLVQ